MAATTTSDVARTGLALSRAGLPFHGGWEAAGTRRETHDGRPVTVVRFQQPAPQQSALSGGPHLSVVLDDEDVLLGYTRLAVPPPGAERELPGEDEARTAAFRFLTGLDPQYAAALAVQWVAPHHEQIAGPGNEPVTVSGTKVKTRHPDGLYAWVVIGADRTVLTFERDIRWDSAAGRRGTEMWLHDRWIAAREGAGIQPSAPYALV
ncbi:hypothetical protein Scani_68120 [Streptomyces caniferus]|uniref:Uncharacterized protein n=1 Tax=Streptomyces caniferus TaxID=285557 RepID=A0A640SI86_9ACTN|nr:hypothetical protein [Streptomyces caniferus]GFE10544.1 hypothetical protein Scani_68120 [Streptomyces caniferus]